ncbi:Amidase [Metarhizium guizhouense ARSEF 977]|uniref:Amidase n=1 Tax=Metarhizium guizhouense (strain ARSEF 977) TaxID=1276136 RepID=A0A0B4GSU4_METGA|nr:Amidase [Metarhizium guizhouense ARSEF 977]
MGSATSIDVLTADIKGLQSLLGQGHVTSRSLVESYLAQIDKQDGYLHAMIQITPTHLLSERAGQMDRERRAGSIRGPLHGIPIIIKASVLGKSTTALGGSMMPSGWSAVGGQTQSAYVRGGLDPNDSKDGHSNPSGSSTGSAVAVSAGYAPVSIGAETDGSLICPAGRASLYTIKPGIGFIPQDGIVPVSSHFDSADAIRSNQGSESLVHNITGSWEDISVGTLDPEVWKFPDTIVKPVTEATEQIGKAKRFSANVPLATPDSFELDGENSETVIIHLNESKVRSLEDIIAFNKQHADQELPTHHPRQDLFIEAQERHVSMQDYNRHLKHLEKAVRGDGVDHILQKYGVDVIIGPADSFLTSMATGSGYPVAGMPLSYLDFNGRAFGLAAIAGQNQEALLIKVLSAWEATFPPRKPPPMLVN